MGRRAHSGRQTSNVPPTQKIIILTAAYALALWQVRSKPVNILWEPLSQLGNTRRMKTKRKLKKRAKPGIKNEWLAVVKSLDGLMAKQTPEESTKARKPLIDKKALSAVNTAYAATLRYYTALLEGGQSDPRVQKQISRLWQHAGTGLRRYDPALANRLKASNSYWSDDKTWKKDTIQKAWAGLNSIRIHSNIMDPDINAVQRWSLFSAS